MVRVPFADSPEFRRLLAPGHGPAPGPDMARVGLEIASDAYPGLDHDRYLARIGELAARVRDRCAALDRPRLLLGQINWVLFVEEGYEGNTDNYYDPHNSYLNEVIDRRTGIPISLSVLYWSVAERVGLPMDGVNLPAHFMLRVGRGDQTVFVDAFHSGALLDRAGCQRLVTRQVGRDVTLTDQQLAPCRRAEVAARMLRNLKAIYLQQNEFTAAVPVQRRLAALSPDAPDEHRDLGMLCLRVDRPAEAVAPLEAYLAARPDAPDVDDLRALLRAARREVARWN
jgi:regulator of sirC expression with transglutaminase-like and TPR domain